MLSFGEMMFYAEAEGLLPTRTGKINAVINDMKDWPYDTLDQDDFEKILAEHELDYDDLTQKEVDYILSKLK